MADGTFRSEAVLLDAHLWLPMRGREAGTGCAHCLKYESARYALVSELSRNRLSPPCRISILEEAQRDRLEDVEVELCTKLLKKKRRRQNQEKHWLAQVFSPT